MKKSPLLWLCALLIALSTFGHAGIVDPQMIVSDPTCGTFAVAIESTSFTFSTVDGGGFYTFCNVSGQNWTNVLVTATAAIDPATIFCGGNAFEFCRVTSPDANNVINLFGPNSVPPSPVAPSAAPPPAVPFQLFFFGATGDYHGIPNNARFTIDLNCPENVACDPWPAVTFQATANVPEPGTMVLLGSGLTLWLRRRLRKS